MNTPVDVDYNNGIGITLSFSDFRIESEGDEDTQQNVFLRGTMIFDFINKYIKENKFISEKQFEVLEVTKETPISKNDIPNGYDVMVYIASDSDYFVREIDDVDDGGDFYDHDIMSDVFDRLVTQRFNNTDITSSVYCSFFSGGG
jgi:hypothetical protein